MIDVDADYRGKVTYPNLAIMKLSAWHKSLGDDVEWHTIGTHYDRVYLSKVFSDEYTQERVPFIDADEIFRGGSGYAITVENGREVHHPEYDKPLPYEVDHIMPDYGIYGITDHAYGFLTKGCPRQCDFCHVKSMQGIRSHTVARLSEFWDGQKYIDIFDPNILACPDWKIHFQDLIDCKSYVEFNQGLDIRMLTEEKVEMLNSIKYNSIHFAWDRPEEDLREKFRLVKDKLKRNRRQLLSCYILTNSGSTHQQDVDRVEFIKSMDIQPYVMVYRQNTAPKETMQLKRYANNPFVCWGTPTFADYKASARSNRFGKTGIKFKEATTIDSLRNGGADERVDL